MRTSDEILQRMEEESAHDFMGTIAQDLIVHLPYVKARAHLKKSTSEDEWNEGVIAEDKRGEVVLQCLKDYLPFALEKCVNHRGISANRSIDHFRSWLWLLEDDDALAFISDSTNYPNYGAPMLKYLCGRYAVDYKALLDSEELEGFENMAQGLCCGMAAECGCGR